jgi:hypothetical protein
MKKYEQLAVFIIRLISLLVLIYFVALAIFISLFARGAGVVLLMPAILALLVYLGARFFARVIARDLD